MIRLARSIILSLVSGLSAFSFAWSQSPQGSGAATYVLGKGATFQQGCFDPCDCLLGDETPLHGTFLLTPQAPDPLFDNYLVSRIRWMAPRGGPALITGEGTYRIGGEFALEERLVLDLSIDGGPVQRFDSGRDIGPSAFPGFDIAISLNGRVCFDTVLTIRARPALDLTAHAGRLSWGPLTPGDASDLLQGDLASLGGGFGLAGSAMVCLADNASPGEHPATGAPDPPVGTGYWYLVRADGMGGSWDSGSQAQAAPRDDQLLSVPACP